MSNTTQSEDVFQTAPVHNNLLTLSGRAVFMHIQDTSILTDTSENHVVYRVDKKQLPNHTMSSAY
ncbi:MAG: hypothetical protein O7G31_12810 [Calditrichaeota bacterium]|nr:hypothetical protein [Calditrichota bacterium]